MIGKSRLPAFAVAAVLQVGCGATLPGTVTFVPTATPGIAYVIVHPSAKNSEGLAGSSEYVLFCDGRFADGMRCEPIEEASLARASRASAVQSAHTEVPLDIGALVSEERVEVDERNTAAVVATPPPPPPPASIPPTTSPAAPRR